MTLLKYVLVVIFVIAQLAVVSCDIAVPASVPSEFVGHWLYESGSIGNEKPEKSIELFKDGTGVCDGYTVSWKVENKRFVMLSSLRGIASYYIITPNTTLELIYDDGTSATFINKKQAKAKAIAAENAKIKAEAEADALAEAELLAETAFKINRDKVKRDSFTDSRDNKTYKIVKLENQTWMAENLNYDTNGSKCYENNPENCKKYGRLYDWNTAREACPKGWHLPNNEEWDALYLFVGGMLNENNPYKSMVAGKYLKAKSGWDDDRGKSGNGTDAYGFTALPGGYGSSDSSFYDVGDVGVWWSASEDYGPDHIAYSRDVDYYRRRTIWYDFDKGYLFSVRCLQDLQ